MFIDDHVAPCRRIGRPPKLTDAELLCLAVAQVLLGFPLGPALDPLRPRPPRPPVPLPAPAVRLQQAPQRRRPPDQPRDRGTGPAGAHLARRPAADRLHPCCPARPPARPSNAPNWPDTAGTATAAATPAFSGASASTWSPPPKACPSPGAWARPETRRTGGDGRATRTRPPPRPPRTGDPRRQGLRREGVRSVLLRAARVHLVRPDREDEPARHGKIARVRRWIEAVIDTLKGQLSLEQHGGRTPAGVFARTGQRLSPSPPASGTTGPPTPPSSDH